MTEPVVKRRVLTKVRSQFLHKRPPNEDEVANTTDLIATPEQLNENSARLLETSLGLVEINRKIYAGYQFLNLNYKVSNLRIESPFHSQTVTFEIQSNGVDMLPWEYCVERLESYGDLELATWADRLKTYHKNYSEMIEKYLAFINSRDPQIMEIVSKAIEQAKLGCRDLESKFVYRKDVFYGNKTAMIPISLTIHEELLKHIDHSVDGFIQWTKKHGILGLFRKDCSIILEQCKQQLTSSGGQQSFFQEGPEYIMDVYDKKGQRKPTKLKMYIVMNPAPEGFFLVVYSLLTDSKPEATVPNNIGDGGVLSARKAPKNDWNSPKSQGVESPEPCFTNDTTQTEGITHDP